MSAQPIAPTERGEVDPGASLAGDLSSRVDVHWALWAALCCLVGLLATWILAAYVPIVHAQDAIALDDFMGLSRPRLDALGSDLLRLLDPVPFVLWGAVLVGVALVRGRPRVAAAVVLVLALAPFTAETLKPLFAHPHVQVSWKHIVDASWPSGHSTAAMALVLCAVLVAPRRLRPAVAALGALFAVAVGFSLLVLAWHMPSDVFGGYLVAALWSTLAIAGLRFSEQHRPAHEEPGTRGEPSRAVEVLGLVAELLVPALVVLGVVLGAVALVLLRVHDLEALADHRALIVAASGIAMLAVLICSTLAAALRR